MTTRAPAFSDGDAIRAALASIVARFTPVDGEHPVAAIPSLTFYRFSGPTRRSTDFSKVALILAVQGSKTITAGDVSYDYDPEHFLLTSVSMPVAGSVQMASYDRPYLSLVMEIDLRHVTDWIAARTLPPAAEAPGAPGIGRGKVSPDLLDAVWRLVRLLDTPQHIAALAPLAEREIIYRLLTGSQGNQLRHALIADSRAFKVSKAVEWIKAHYLEPIRINDLAEHVSMSLSSLHQHFKDTTTLSPLQYQKRLRLFEARQLLLRRGSDVRVVASAVGYENLSQFHREYKRLFGLPPAQDTLSLRADGSARERADS